MGEEKNVFKALMLFIVGCIGAIIGFFVASFVSSGSNRQGVSGDKDSLRDIDSGLAESKVGLERGKERIDSSTDSLDASIDRLKRALAIMESAEKRNNDLQDK